MFGIFIPVVVIVSSLILLFRLRFFILTSFGKIIGCAFRSLRRVEARRSFYLALAGTLGVGNIVGVAVGIIIGGVGSVFWLVISSFFSMILKYAEVSLSLLNCKKNRYGMISLVKDSYLRSGTFFAFVYALLCVVLSFFMGAMLQSSSVCISLSELSGFSRYSIAAALCFSVIIAVSFKSVGIIKVVSWLLPVSSILYLFLCSVCILKGSYRVPRVLWDILRSAFSFGAFGGGFWGFIISSGIKEGFSRGLLSNEAGAGTSTLAHVTNSASSPAEAGVLGMAEVIVDTVVFCPMTALAILVNVGDVSAYPSGISLIMDSVGGAFWGAKAVLSVCIFIFAYATVICWFYYGSVTFKYVFGGGVPIFSVIYVASVMLGSVVGDIVAVSVTDAILLLLTIITSVTLIKRSDRLIYLSECGGLIKPRSKYQAKPSLHPRI